MREILAIILIIGTSLAYEVRYEDGYLIVGSLNISNLSDGSYTFENGTKLIVSGEYYTLVPPASSFNHSWHFSPSFIAMLASFDGAVTCNDSWCCDGNECKKID